MRWLLCTLLLLLPLQGYADCPYPEDCAPTAGKVLWRLDGSVANTSLTTTEQPLSLSGEWTEASDERYDNLDEWGICTGGTGESIIEWTRPGTTGSTFRCTATVSGFTDGVDDVLINIRYAATSAVESGVRMALGLGDSTASAVNMNITADGAVYADLDSGDCIGITAKVASGTATYTTREVVLSCEEIL